MRQFALAAVISSAVVSGPALAADLGMPVKAPAVVVAETFNWSGFYVGAMGGYGWGRIRAVDFAGATQNIDGPFVGGTIGVNFQAPGSAWVWGLEVDSAWADIGRSITVGGFTASSTTDYIGTARARLGGSVGHALIYATGGVAWMNNTLSATLVGVGGISNSQFHVGWTAGGGVEWALSQNWSAKAEYLYMDFGAENYFAALGGLRISSRIHTVKAGINYRFNWGGPVVAAY